MAAGLGSMDTPIPQVATWEWANWKFLKPVRAGETIFARWTLTQKRPPVHGSKTGIVVWRVDVHTADGTLCAEGEIGAAVFRRAAVAAAPERVDSAPAAVPAGRRRRKRRTGTAPETAAAPPPQAVSAPAAAAERAPRRRRRRRPSGSAAGNHTDPAGPGLSPESSAGAEGPAPAPPPVPGASPPAATAANPISRVMRRLRRT
jgi:hypothetical protein